MVREAICPCLLKSSKYLQYPYIYMDYFVIKNTCNVALISTMEFDICDLRKLSVAQTTVEGMDNKLSNYSQRMFKEVDVLKADPGICVKGSRQITKNLRRYRRCHDGGLYSTPSKYSVIIIATRYGLHGPGIESRWGRDFPHLSRQALGFTQPHIQ
jgi:hypothetical protein